MNSGSPVNSSEAFVLDVCKKAALSLWCYNNPISKPGKELCDILVVCDPHIIIVSVKDVRLRDPNLETEHVRWERKAVDDSVRQIYGAERKLASATQVTRCDGSPGLPLPPVGTRIIHRIAVAFGGRGEVITKSHNFDKGFVHVMTEQSLTDVLTELDTIADLVHYLAAKETLVSTTSVIIEGSEANLLGWYLAHGRTFPTGHDLMLVDDTIWRGLQGEPAFKRRKDADGDSYVWDRLIDLLADPNAKPVTGPGPSPTNLEMALRIMALENRFSRRILGKAVREFLEQAKAKTLRSRLLVAPSGILYVLTYFSATESPKSRESELGCRCLAARHRVGRGDTIVGIGLSDHVPGVGSASDLIYLYLPDWSPADDERAAKMLADLGYFAGAGSTAHSDEFPQT